MSELTQTLKIYVTRYPGTMAELARKASIDRSTLYKIVSGQRTPREFQLEHLADALELSEEQKSALLLQPRERHPPPSPARYCCYRRCAAPNHAGRHENGKPADPPCSVGPA